MKNVFNLKNFLFATSLAFCFQAQAISLEQATKTAFENSHELKQLKLESDYAGWGQIKAVSGYLPKVEVRGRHLFDEKFEELEVPFGGSTFVMPAIQPYSSLGVGATIDIFNGFETFNEVGAASSQKRAAEFRLKRAEEQKRMDVRSIFYKALGSQILLEVADQTIETLESHLKDVNSRVRSGVSTRYDVLRAEVQLDDVKTEKVAAQDSIAIARAKLFEAIGQPDDGKPLEGKVPDDFGRIDVTKLTLQNIERHDRDALIADGEQAEKLSGASKAHWLPHVGLFGEYEWYNNINHSVSESDQRFKSAYSFGLSLSWNIFDGGASFASQRQAALASGIAAEKLARFEENMPVVLEEAKRKFSYNVINYTAKLNSIRKAEEAVRLAKGGLRAGIRTNTDVLDAVVDLNRAKASAVKSQIDAIEALGQLELSVGRTL